MKFLLEDEERLPGEVDLFTYQAELDAEDFYKNNIKDKDDIESWFEALVPESGKANTVAGELVRAMMRLLYRDHNDGDRFFSGYGVETCGGSAQFLMENTNDWISNKLIEMAEDDLRDDAYTDALNEVGLGLITFLKEHKELISKPNEEDSRYWELDEEFIPKYDFDCEIPSYIQDLIDSGKYTEEDLESEIYYWEANGQLGHEADKINVHGDRIYIDGVQEDTYNELERNMYRWLEDFADNLYNEYGDIEDEEEEEDIDESLHNNEIEQHKKLTKDIGLKTLGDLKTFKDHQGSAELDALKDYKKELDLDEALGLKEGYASWLCKYWPDDEEDRAQLDRKLRYLNLKKELVDKDAIIKGDKENIQKFMTWLGLTDNRFSEIKEESLKEDTIKQNGKWVNKGKEGTHGTFRTKKEADAQRKAMFARGFKEDLEEYIYLFPELTEEDKEELHNYDLAYLGKNKFVEADYEEISDVVKGTKEDLNKYAEEYLDYILHPDYLYKEEDFAGEIYNEKLSEAVELDEISKLAEEINNAFEEENKYYDVYPYNGKLECTIENGDWKHDHLYFEYFVKDFLENKGYVVDIDKKIIGESEDDSYSASYTISITKDSLDEKLIQGKSDATLKKNIKTEIEAGKDPKQAYAIAKSIQDKHMKESLINFDGLKFGDVVSIKNSLEPEHKYQFLGREKISQEDLFRDLQTDEIVRLANDAILIKESKKCSDNLDLNKNLEEALKDIKEVERKLDLFPNQITINKELADEVKELLLDRNISFMIDDHITADGREGDRFTFKLKFPTNEQLEKEKCPEKKDELEGEIEKIESEIDYADDHNNPSKVISLQQDLEMLKEDDEADYFNGDDTINEEPVAEIELDIYADDTWEDPYIVSEPFKPEEEIEEVKELEVIPDDLEDVEELQAISNKVVEDLNKQEQNNNIAENKEKTIQVVESILDEEDAVVDYVNPNMLQEAVESKDVDLSQLKG